jgi:hypothetical protein
MARFATVLLQFLNKLIHVYIVFNTAYIFVFPHPLTLIIKYCFFHYEYHNYIVNKLYIYISFFFL